MGLEKEVKATEERLREAASRETVMLEAKQQAINKFKQSEEYKASQDYDTNYDNGYVEEIFYNIRRNRYEVNYKFLRKEYQQLIADW